MYSQPIDNEKMFRQSIINACETIQNRPRTFELIRQSLRHRVNANFQLNVDYFEHLL